MGKQDLATRRLSKPRSINRSSTTLLDISDRSLDASSPLTSSDVDYFGDRTTVTSRGERRSKSKSRSKLHAYLHGTRNDLTQALSSDEDMESPSSHRSGAARKARIRLSRSGSVFAQLSSAKESSTQLSNASNTRLLETTDPEDSIAVAEEIKQRAQKDSLAADHHFSSPPEDDMHCDSFFPPVRRKSLYTPGLATRSASDILRKPPATAPQSPQSMLSEAERNYYYNPSHPQSSPLSSLAALKLPEDGRASPSTLDIPNLGGLKLGSLHVTNGIGSPSLLSPQPDSACNSPTLSSTDKDVYHTASEANVDESKTSIDYSVGEHPALGTSFTTAHYLQNAADEKLHVPPSPTPQADHDTGCASLMAHEYIAELSDGPFAGPSPAAELIEVQNWANNEASDDSDPFHKPESAGTFDSGYYSNESIYDGERGHSVSPQKHPFIKPSTRYESEGSWGHPPGGNLPVHESRIHDLGYAEPADCPVYSPDMVNQAPVATSAHTPGRRLRKTRPKSQIPLQCATGLDLHQLAGANIPRVPSAMALKHAERLVDFPLLEHTFPSSEHVTVNDSPRMQLVQLAPVRFPSPVANSQTSTYRKSINPVYLGPNVNVSTIRPTPNEAALVENVTAPSRPEIVRSLSWSAFGLNKNKEETKLVKKSEEAGRRAEKEAKELEKQLEKERKNQDKRLREESKDKGSRSRASSRVRRKSAERRMSQAEITTTIADFGDVTESLGCSPYDIATSLGPASSRRQSGCHPHQISSARQRPRSFVGMDDASASEFAHARSRLRQQCLQQNVLGGATRPKTEFLAKFDVPPPSDDGTRAHDGERVNRQPRRRSWSNQTPVNVRSISHDRFDDRGGIPGKTLRPYSGILDAPPIPTLPSNGQKRPTRCSETKRLPEPAPRTSGHVEGTSASQGANSARARQTRRAGLPDLWSNGSLEKKTRKPTTAAENQGTGRQDDSNIEWEAHRNAWRQRRKSAGEALLTQNRLANVVGEPGNSGHRPTGQYHIPRKDIGSSPARRADISPSVAALAGRYEGGLLFGYERGCGLGGSAGTRNLGNMASRKGSDVSKGYGLDFSDLPVFVAATPR